MTSGDDVDEPARHVDDPAGVDVTDGAATMAALTNASRRAHHAIATTEHAPPAGDGSLRHESGRKTTLMAPLPPRSIAVVIASR